MTKDKIISKIKRFLKNYCKNSAGSFDFYFNYEPLDIFQVIYYDDGTIRFYDHGGAYYKPENLTNKELNDIHDIIFSKEYLWSKLMDMNNDQVALQEKLIKRQNAISSFMSEFNFFM